MACIQRIGLFSLSVALRKVVVKNIQILKQITLVSLKYGSEL